MISASYLTPDPALASPEHSRLPLIHKIVHLGSLGTEIDFKIKKLDKRGGAT